MPFPLLMLQIRKRFSSGVEPEHATSRERFRRPCWSFGYLGQHHSLHKRLPQVGQDDSAWLWCTFLYFSCKGIFEVKCFFLFVCMFSHGRDMQVCVWDLHEGRRTVAHSLHTGSVGFCQCCLLEADGSKTLLALPAENMEEVTYQNMSYTCLQLCHQALCYPSCCGHELKSVVLGNQWTKASWRSSGSVRRF